MAKGWGQVLWCIRHPHVIDLTHPCRLQLVTELLLFDNMLESLPASLFQMSSLEMLNVDRNHLMEIPATVRMNTLPEKGVI